MWLINFTQDDKNKKMTKRDFFRVIIKLFALYSVILTVFSLMPTYFSYAYISFDSVTLFLALGVVVCILILLIAILYGTDKIIDILKLDKGFDDDHIVIGNFNESNILKLAIILISGFLILDNIPILINQAYLAFKNQVSVNGLNNNYQIHQLDYFQLTISIVCILLGYLMITNYSTVSKWLLNADKKSFK